MKKDVQEEIISEEESKDETNGYWFEKAEAVFTIANISCVCECRFFSINVDSEKCT